MSAQQQMANDIGRNIASKLHPLLEREIRIAIAGGLEGPELAMLALKVGASIANGMILVGVQFARPEVDKEAFYDFGLDALVRLTRQLKAEGLAVVHQRGEMREDGK